MNFWYLFIHTKKRLKIVVIFGAGSGNRTHVISLEGWGSTIELHPHNWSGRRDSNSRPSPWQGDALPLSHFRTFVIQNYFVKIGRGRWIRTIESSANGFTVRPLWPLGNPSKLCFSECSVGLSFTLHSVQAINKMKLSPKLSHIIQYMRYIIPNF